MRLSLRPLVICGPSGCGKSTLVKMLMNEFSNRLAFTVSHTTRKPRPGEIHGKDYYFMKHEEMQREIEKNKFIETAVFSGNLYGTSLKAVEDLASCGKVAILDIDIEGVRQVKQKLNPWSVFIRPPSLEQLTQRLIKRNTETQESLRLRLQRANEDMEYGLTPGNFDLVLVNDDLERAYKELREFVVKNVLKDQKNTESVNARL